MPETTTPTLVTLPVDQLDRNAWNPNQMPPEDFAEYVAEVRRLGRVPKPIVVRPDGDRFQIVDGEHAWRAAQEVGFSEVLCEVIEADDYAARLQTLKRNLHGTHNPVLEGRLFAEMKAASHLSNVKLAKQIGISEGTVRNSLIFAEAAERRRQYLLQREAAERGVATSGALDAEARNRCEAQADAEIAKLPVRVAELYTWLVEPIGDFWVDTHGLLTCLKPYLRQGKVGLVTHFLPVVNLGLADLVKNKNFIEFSCSLDRVCGLAEWLKAHANFADGQAYARVVGELGLSPYLLDHLPCRRDGETYRCLLSVDEWRSILANAQEHTNEETDCEALVSAGVRVALTKKGINLAQAFGPKIAEVLQQLDSAPEYIRQADHLALDEQLMLFQTKLDVDDELAEAAKRLAVARLREQRSGQRDPATFDGVYSTLQDALRQAVREGRLATENELVADREKQIDAIIAHPSTVTTLENIVVDGQPAIALLRQQVAELPDQLRVMLACAMQHRAVVPPAARWLETVKAGGSPA